MSYTQKHKNTGKKPAKPISSHSFLATATEMNNKQNMNKNNHIHPHPYNPHPENQINQMNQWFRQSPNQQMQSYLSVATALREGYRKSEQASPNKKAQTESNLFVLHKI
jgi:hypothetical protein